MKSRNKKTEILRKSILEKEINSSINKLLRETFKYLYTTMNCGASLIHQKYGAIGVSYFGSIT